LTLFGLGSVSRTDLDWRQSVFGFHHPRVFAPLSIEGGTIVQTIDPAVAPDSNNSKYGAPGELQSE
jgi:hypothetical protein